MALPATQQNMTLLGSLNRTCFEVPLCIRPLPERVKYTLTELVAEAIGHSLKSFVRVLGAVYALIIHDYALRSGAHGGGTPWRKLAMCVTFLLLARNQDRALMETGMTSTGTAVYT